MAQNDYDDRWTKEDQKNEECRQWIRDAIVSGFSDEDIFKIEKYAKKVMRLDYQPTIMPSVNGFSKFDENAEIPDDWTETDLKCEKALEDIEYIASCCFDFNSRKNLKRFIQKLMRNYNAC